MKISYHSSQRLQKMALPFAIDDSYFGLEAYDQTTSIGLLVAQHLESTIYIHHLTYKIGPLQVPVQLLHALTDYGSAMDVTAFHYAFEANHPDALQECTTFLRQAGWSVPAYKILYYVVAKSQNPLYQRGSEQQHNCQILPLSQIPWDIRLSYVSSHGDDLDFSQYPMLEPTMSLALIQNQEILGYCLVQVEGNQLALTKMVWPENKALGALLAAATSHALESLPYPTILVHIHTQMGALVCQKWFGNQILSTHQIMESHLLR